MGVLLMRDPLVSIVVPVKNGGGYLKLALESALAQTYDRTEIVIVDDGSDDDGHTARVCAEFVRRDPDRVSYIRQNNQGVAGALNTGVAAMRGDIFSWLSHDDLFDPEKTARQAAFFTRLAKPDAAVICDYRLIDPEGRTTWEVKLPQYRLMESPALPLFIGGINGCTTFLPRRLLESSPFPPLRYTQDYSLWLDLLQETDFFHLPQTLVSYRQHPGQDSAKPEVLSENETLWKRICTAPNETRRVQLFGSTYAYYAAMAAHLESSPYNEAADLMRTRRDGCLAEAQVTVIVALDDHHDLPEVLAEYENEAGSRLQVLVTVSDPAHGAGLPAFARILEAPTADLGMRLNLGIAKARGECIAFRTLRAAPSRTVIDRHERAARAGAPVFYDGADVGPYPDLTLRRSPPLDEAIFHSAAFEPGIRFEPGLTAAECITFFWWELALRRRLVATRSEVEGEPLCDGVRRALLQHLTGRPEWALAFDRLASAD